VKYSLFKDGSEVAYIVFNGTGSTIEDWFSAIRKLEASWSDLIDRQQFVVFSIKG